MTASDIESTPEELQATAEALEVVLDARDAEIRKLQAAVTALVSEKLQADWDKDRADTLARDLRQRCASLHRSYADLAEQFENTVDHRDLIEAEHERLLAWFMLPVDGSVPREWVDEIGDES
jgi:chromosome segregation ATPase